MRYDPFDAGIAYAYVGKRWVQCVSEHYSRLKGKSERELMLATAELRRRAQNHAGQFTVTAIKLADFLASVEAEETLRVQRLRDHEAKDVSRTADGAGLAAVEQASLAGSADQQDLEEVTAAATPGVAMSDQPTAYEEY